MAATILAADDNADALFALTTLLQNEGYTVVSAENGTDAFALAEEHIPDLAILDVNMPGLDGCAVTEKMKQHPELRYTPVILLSANSELDDVETGLDRGADEYIVKPFERRELLARLKAALRIHALYRDLRAERARGDALQTRVEDRFRFGNLIGRSASMRAVYDLIEKVKDSKVPVLITGESGTGKELVAAAIHYNSIRKGKPFVAQNCSAFSESLLESELFGHVKGAFTGALRDKPGLFEMADGGTLFLDEIGEMKAILQAKLLRVLQDGTFLPVGGSKPKTVDVRVVAATNRDLQVMIKEGTFREDLFYRLNVISIKLPPLRERAADIPALAEHFLEASALRDKRDRKRLTADMLKLLCEYRWPGNVRELQNEIERLILMASGEDIGVEFADERLRGGISGAPSSSSSQAQGTLPEAVAAVEKSLIVSTLEKTKWNKSEAARLLGISRSNLIEKVKVYGLEQE